MKQRILIVLAGVALLVATVSAPALAAGGGPARFQVTTSTYTMAIGFGHTYNVVINPCGSGTVVASGWQWGADGDPTVHNPDETITATLSADGTMLTFDPAVYVGGWAGSPYSWHGTFPVAGGTFTVYASDGGVYENVAITRTSTSTTAWKNHGEYVSATGGGSDAAHSCIGMPMTDRGDPMDAISPSAMAGRAAALAAKLEAVAAKLTAGGHANAAAVAAIGRHVDALKAGSSKPTHPAKPSKPTLPTHAQNHSTPGNHPGKP